MTTCVVIKTIKKWSFRVAGRCSWGYINLWFSRRGFLALLTGNPAVTISMFLCPLCLYTHPLYPEELLYHSWVGLDFLSPPLLACLHHITYKLIPFSVSLATVLLISVAVTWDNLLKVEIFVYPDQQGYFYKVLKQVSRQVAGMQQALCSPLYCH